MNNKHKVISIMLFILSIVSIALGLLLIAILNLFQPVVYFSAYFVEHSWIMFFFLIAPVITAFYGIKMHKLEERWVKNIIAGGLSAVIIILLGCFFLFGFKVSHDWSYIEDTWANRWFSSCKGEVVSGPIYNDEIKISKIKLIDDGSKELRYANITAGAKGMKTDEFDFGRFRTVANYKYMFAGADRYILMEREGDVFINTSNDWGKDVCEEEGKIYYFYAYNLDTNEIIMIEFVGKK